MKLFFNGLTVAITWLALLPAAIAQPTTGLAHPPQVIFATDR